MYACSILKYASKVNVLFSGVEPESSLIQAVCYHYTKNINNITLLILNIDHPQFEIQEIGYWKANLLWFIYKSLFNVNLFNLSSIKLLSIDRKLFLNKLMCTKSRTIH